MNTVAFSFTPSRIGIFTAHCKSTAGSSLTDFCCARTVAAPIRTNTTRNDEAARKLLDVRRNISPPHLRWIAYVWLRAHYVFRDFTFLREPPSLGCGFAPAILSAG